MGVSPSSTEGIKPIMGQGIAHRDRERQDGRTRAGRGGVAVVVAGTIARPLS